MNCVNGASGEHVAGQHGEGLIKYWGPELEALPP